MITDYPLWVNYIHFLVWFQQSTFYVPWVAWKQFSIVICQQFSINQYLHRHHDFQIFLPHLLILQKSRRLRLRLLRLDHRPPLLLVFTRFCFPCIIQHNIILGCVPKVSSKSRSSISQASDKVTNCPSSILLYPSSSLSLSLTFLPSLFFLALSLIVCENLEFKTS